MGDITAGRPLEEQIRSLAEPIAEAEGVELIHVECVRMKTRWIVRIFLDRTEGGVTLDDCARVSHVLGDLLEVHDVPPGPYTLEVSSPGPNRPISRDRDFVRFRGCPVMLRLDGTVDGRRQLRGTIAGYEAGEPEKELLVEAEGVVLRIPRGAILKANLAEAPEEDAKPGPAGRKRGRTRH